MSVANAMRKSSSAVSRVDFFKLNSLSLEELIPVLRDIRALFTDFLSNNFPISVIVQKCLSQI